MLIDQFDHMGRFFGRKKNKVKIAIENKSDCFITEKILMKEQKMQSVVRLGVWKLRLQFTEKGKFCWASCCETWLKEKKWKVNLRLLREKKWNQGFFFCLLGSYPLVGRHVVKHGKNLKVKLKVLLETKKMVACGGKIDEIFPKYFSGRGLCLTHVGAPCCEWTKSWVLCCKRTWNILSRTTSGSFTCVYTRGLSGCRVPG